jgi:hypothetical protein
VPDPAAEGTAADVATTAEPAARPASRRRAAGPTLTVISWRDIPAQVTARDGERTEKLELHRRFQVAIDRAAVQAGLDKYDDYIAQWRSAARPCGPDLAAEVAAEAARIDAAHPRDTLDRLVAQGGLATEEPIA